MLAFPEDFFSSFKSSELDASNLTASNLTACKINSWVLIRNHCFFSQNIVFQLVAITSCLFVVASTMALIISTLPMFKVTFLKITYTMRTNLLNWCNLVSISKNVVFYAFLVVRIY